MIKLPRFYTGIYVRSIYYHVQKTVQSIDEKALLHLPIQIDNVTQAKRPHIALKDKKLDHTWVTDIAVPGNRRED